MIYSPTNRYLIVAYVISTNHPNSCQHICISKIINVPTYHKLYYIIGFEINSEKLCSYTWRQMYCFKYTFSGTLTPSL